jgi:hypothetical protein
VRDQGIIEALEPAVTHAVELIEAALGRCDQTVDVHVHAAATEGLEVGDPATPQSSGTGRVAAPQVLEAHADLEDPLVEVADGVALGEPLLLERLVLLEELPAVELLDPAPEARRRRLGATAAALSSAGPVVYGKNSPAVANSVSPMP